MAGAWAQKTPQKAQSDAIVSEKDSVKLVEDSTVSEAISRRPDLSFANVTIDGEVTQVSLDSISADSVASMEVMKAVTPDQDADSRGGSISLKTRPAYTQSSVSTKVDVSAIYESISGQPGYGVSVNVGGPLNESRTLGGRLGVSYEVEDEGIHYVSKDWYRRTVDGESQHALKELKLFDMQMWNRTQEVNGGLDYKLSDTMRLFWKGSYSSLLIDNSLPHFEYRFKEGDFTAIDANGANVENAEVELGIYAYEYEREELETSIGGEWDHGDLQADFRLMLLEQDHTPIDYINLDFVASGVDLRYDLEDARFPTVAITNDKDFYDTDAYRFEDFTFSERINRESDSVASANFKWRNAFGSERLNLRFGLKGRVRDDLVDSEASYYEGYSGEGAFTLSSAFRQGAASEVAGRYLLDTQADEDLADAYIAERLDSFEYNERRSRERSDSGSYFAEERVDAYYGMIDYQIGKWRSLIGYRQENTSVSFTSNEVLLGQDFADKDNDGDTDEIVYLNTTPTYGSTSYGNAFPNTHVRYRWNDRTTFIASYTNTIQRPLYAQIVPFRRVDLEDREIEEGNPDLDPTLYANIDMSVDVRIGDQGMVSVELFDRKIDDYIFETETVISGGIYDGFILERQENSSSAQMRGLSLTWNQPFRLPLIEEGLSLNANYVKQETTLEYPARPGEILSLSRQPDNEFKIALSYEKDRIFAQLKINQEDETIYQVATHPENDIYVAPSSYVGLNVSYKLQKKARLYMEWANLTSQPYFESYEGDPSRPYSYRIRPWSLTTGMKFEL